MRPLQVGAPRLAVRFSNGGYTWEQQAVPVAVGNVYLLEHSLP
jgi:hypothetical protein